MTCSAFTEKELMVLLRVDVLLYRPRKTRLCHVLNFPLVNASLTSLLFILRTKWTIVNWKTKKSLFTRPRTRKRLSVGYLGRPSRRLIVIRQSAKKALVTLSRMISAAAQHCHLDGSLSLTRLATEVRVTDAAFPVQLIILCLTNILIVAVDHLFGRRFATEDD